MNPFEGLMKTAHPHPRKFHWHKKLDGVHKSPDEFMTLSIEHPTSSPAMAIVPIEETEAQKSQKILRSKPR